MSYSKSIGSRWIIMLGVIGGLFISSCGESSTDDAMTDASAISEGATEEQVGRVKKIFYAIPSPVEMVSLIQDMGSRYDYSVLNKVENRTKYNTAKSKAVNLGIYGADLSYTSVFNQNQESILYMSCAKQLADDLGISGAFSDATMARVEENLENRDSLLHIITETYYELDAYLKENDRSNISAQVITGGWLEGLYLASKMVEKSGKGNELSSRLIDQKYALKDLIALNEANNKDGSLDDILVDLKALESVYDGADSDNSTVETSVDADGKVTLGGGPAATMSDAAMDELIALAKEIRTKYVM
ncbi:MAG: hypothetical protein O2867_00450 [Bacteroidetes bacterium]|nr:hypothetical protein [Bacteroidota bacterium]MDA0972179.1 hypothetical protein [Bacteroidota bacterium]